MDDIYLHLLTFHLEKTFQPTIIYSFNQTIVTMKRKIYYLLALMLVAGSGIAQKAVRCPLPSDGGVPAGTEVSTGQTVGNETDAMTVWALPGLGATSANTRCPGNTWNYQRTEYLIRPAEMAASGFPSGITVDAIGFLILTAGTTNQTGNFKVWLKNTTDVTYTLGATWTTAGFTLVSDIASWTVPITAGSYLVNFSGGSPFTYTGGGVYVAWEFSNPGTVGTGALVANCNTSLLSGLYGARSTSSLPTTLVVSDWRPATQFANNSLTDVLQVTNVYAMEKCPLPYGAPTPVTARVVNVSAAAETFTVTLTVTDQATSAVRYTNTQTVTALAGGAATVVSFAPWTPANQENDNVTVTVSAGTGETYLANNTKTIPVNINNNLFGYAFTPAPSTGYGYTYTGAGGIFANKFHMNGVGSISGANIFIYNYTANAGNTVYAVVLNSAGAIVAQSDNLVIATGDLGTNKEFTFATPPAFNNEDFFVGLAQPTGGTVQWYPIGCMSESPYRADAFYGFDITGGTPALFGADYKFLIEAVIGGATLLADDVGTTSIDFGNIVTTGVMVPQATVKNYGANTETFTVTMTIGSNYNSTKTVTALASGATAQVSFDQWISTLGDYTVNVCTNLADLDPTNNCKTQPLKVLNLNKQVYAYNAFPGSGTDPEGPTSFNLHTPGALTSLADQSSMWFVAGGTWADGSWYGTVYDTIAPYGFITLNTTTGARTVVGTMGASMNGLSYNPADHTMYGVGYNSATTSSELYTINKTTGATTLVGSTPGVLLINLAINNEGVCYSVDVNADNLGTVNLATGAFTIIGSLGFSASYAQDMEFDRESGELYMAAYGSSGWLGWVNKTTGAVTKIGDFEGGAELTGFAIPYSSIPSNINVSGVVNEEENPCYNATNTITVGGESTPFTVNAFGSATLIAGQKITMLPGTKVNLDGSLVAKISDGTYCNGVTLTKSVVASNNNEGTRSMEKAGFSLFPNPTSGNFTLVLKGEEVPGNVTVEIYTTQGEKVLVSGMIGEKSREFVTSGLPMGIYFVRITGENYSETIKLIKTR